MKGAPRGVRLKLWIEYKKTKLSTRQAKNEKKKKHNLFFLQKFQYYASPPDHSRSRPYTSLTVNYKAHCSKAVDF